MIDYTTDTKDAPMDLEVLKLRKEVLELKKQLEAAQQVLVENGLEEVGPKPVEPAEVICCQQIDILKQLSDKGMPFDNNEVKNFEVLVKTLLAIRGKSIPVDETKKSKKKEEHKIADLLEIVKNSPKSV